MVTTYFVITVCHCNICFYYINNLFSETKNMSLQCSRSCEEDFSFEVDDEGHLKSPSRRSSMNHIKSDGDDSSNYCSLSDDDATQEIIPPDVSSRRSSKSPDLLCNLGGKSTEEDIKEDDIEGE